jgi:hypothetical protein
MNPRAVQLIDCRSTPPGAIGGVVIRDFPDSAFGDVERVWGPERGRLPPTKQHTSWDWVRKIGWTAFRFLAVQVGNSVEGLAALKRSPLPSLTTPSDFTVEIAILEAAPWNVDGHPDGIRYRGVGTALIVEAVLLSREAGHAGRVQLSALPQAESWYRRRGMTEVGPQPPYGLVYFEYTQAQADDLLARNGVIP